MEIAKKVIEIFDEKGFGVPSKHIPWNFDTRYSIETWSFDLNSDNFQIIPEEGVPRILKTQQRRKSVNFLLHHIGFSKDASIQTVQENVEVMIENERIVFEDAEENWRCFWKFDERNEISIDPFTVVISWRMCYTNDEEIISRLNKEPEVVGFTEYESDNEN